MPKKKKSKVKKFEYSQFEKLLIKGDKLKKQRLFTERQLEIINSILSWERSNGYITGKQLNLLETLIRRAKDKEKPKQEERLYLYAIGDGINVKLGLSNNPEKRRKTLSTSSARQLRILWFVEVDGTRVFAMQQERKLHRYCKKHRIKGEWFDLACMDKVNKFTPKKQQRKKAVEEKLDEELLNSCPF